MSSRCCPVACRQYPLDREVSLRHQLDQARQRDEARLFLTLEGEQHSVRWTCGRVKGRRFRLRRWNEDRSGSTETRGTPDAQRIARCSAAAPRSVSLLSRVELRSLPSPARNGWMRAGSPKTVNFFLIYAADGKNNGRKTIYQFGERRGV
jgi:hypothetical protein